MDKVSGEYKFKDFSTGKYGSKIDLVQELHENVKNYSEAVFKIIQDFNSYVLKNGSYEVAEFKEYSKYQVDFTRTRPWKPDDRDFWLQFGVGTTILFEYNVKAIDYYKMSKEVDGELKEIKIRGPKLYGYFDKNGKVYKIYQPLQKQHKFIKVFHHIQGLDQLKYNQPYLVICSSLKDAMTLRHFNYNVEVIAPDSENTMIKPYVIKNLNSKYKQIITLFDNDEAGLKAIKKYEDTYGIKGTVINMSKDLSDAVRDFGFNTVHEELKTLLRKVLNKQI